MSNYSVKRPITVLMGILIVIVLGVFSLTKLPLTLFPDINLPYIVTITTYQGASPLVVEEEVSSKIESAVQTIGNFKEVSSMSNEHFAVSIITFNDSTNMDTVIIELRELINNINFKEGIGNVRILRISPDMLPVVITSLFKTDNDELTDEEILIKNTEWINNEVINDLRSIPGVADITIQGAADVVLQINLNNALLGQYHLNTSNVLSIIEEQNVGGLIGVALDNGEIRMLYLGDQVSDLTNIKKLPITKDGDSIVKLENLVVDNGIKYTNGNQNTYSKINNKQGIQISFQMQTNYSVTEVSNNIIKRLDEITKDNQDASYQIILNQGEYIKLSINSVLNNLIIGGILAILILLFFLKDFKPTLIVGLAIPISVIGSFMLMYFAGVSLNVVSMGGLALGIGMLVDNSIVVIENIYRLINEGKSKKEAAIYGAKEVASAITSSTLTTVAVFLPILFMEGMIADVFMSMAYTIAFSLGSSLFIALTLVPTMASKMLSDDKTQKESKFFNKINHLIERNIEFNLKHKYVVVIMIFVLLTLSIMVISAKGFIMLPETDEGNISISLQVNAKVPFGAKAQLTDKLTESLLEINDIETISASINAGSMMGFMSLGQNQDISLSIRLKQTKAKSTKENETIIKNLLNDFSFNIVEGITKDDLIDIEVSSQNSAMSITGSKGISIKVAGQNLEKLEMIAGDITKILAENGDLTKIKDGINRGTDNIKLTIDKDNAMTNGLTMKDVSNSINYLFHGLTSLTSPQKIVLSIDNVDYEVEIPTEAIGNLDLNSFGNYLDFLSGVLLFDKETQKLIDDYLESNPNGIYVPNAILPGYDGTTIKFVINPYLKVDSNQIILNPMSASPSLASFAKAHLFDDLTESVAKINYMTGFSTINTDGNSYYLTITATPIKGKSVTLIGNKVNKDVEAYLSSDLFKSYGRGYQVSFIGENEEIMNAVNDLIIASIVAILLVYLIMAIQFQSLTYPLIILITIPLAFTGGLFALIICGMQLSIVAIMGLIILVGVVVNNGIVLVDYINKLILEGSTIKKALVTASKTRLRPILMTALTTILGLFAMALGIGQGAELLQPMAITTIGGLIFSTILTLTIVPLIYAMFNRRQLKLEENDGINEATSN